MVSEGKGLHYPRWPQHHLVCWACQQYNLIQSHLQVARGCCPLLGDCPRWTIEPGSHLPLELTPGVSHKTWLSWLMYLTISWMGLVTRCLTPGNRVWPGFQMLCHIGQCNKERSLDLVRTTLRHEQYIGIRCDLMTAQCPINSKNVPYQGVNLVHYMGYWLIVTQNDLKISSKLGYDLEECCFKVTSLGKHHCHMLLLEISDVGTSDHLGGYTAVHNELGLFRDTIDPLNVDVLYVIHMTIGPTDYNI